MKLLLDTHAFLWFATDDPRLSVVARQLIEDGHNERWLSVASVWEMAIKLNLRKLTLADPLDVFIAREVPANQTSLLSIEGRHAVPVATLPLHHRDPFDRLLVAQAMVEQAVLVSNDTQLDAYGITRQW